MTTFLTTDEVAELTGIKKGRNGKTREVMQAAMLSTMGIPHFINRIGRPIVARAAIEGASHVNVKPSPAWAPSLAAA